MITERQLKKLTVFKGVYKTKSTGNFTKDKNWKKNLYINGKRQILTRKVQGMNGFFVIYYILSLTLVKLKNDSLISWKFTVIVLFVPFTCLSSLNKKKYVYRNSGSSSS